MRVAAFLCLLGGAAGAGPLADAMLTAELSRNYDADLLAKAVASPDPADRLAAARCLGRLKDPRGIGWLVTLLGDPAAPVRRSALFALGQVGTADVVIPLRSALPRLPASELPFGLEALGKTKDPRVVADIAFRLRHDDADARGRAALALARAGDFGATQDVFAALTKETDPEVRWRLVYAMWILIRERARRDGKPVAAPAEWAAILNEASAPERPFDERVFALRGLAQIEGQRAVLVERFKDPDARIVVEALRGTAKPFDNGTAALVAPLCGHEDVLVREEALENLAAGGAEAADLVAGARLDDEPRLGARARVVLAAAGRDPAPLPEGTPEDLAEETAWRIAGHLPARMPAALPKTVRGQVAAAESCGQAGVPIAKAVEILLELLFADDFAVRSTAVTSLATRGAKDQAPAIVAAARASKEMDVRIEAATALGTLGVMDDWLAEAAAGDPEVAVRAAARDGLKKLGRPVPPGPPLSGFRLHGHDTLGVRAAADALEGARLVLETTRGTIVIRLHPDSAPAHCVNVAALAGQGFYDGLTWHRVVADFVIQGGCPRGDGSGTGGVVLPDEIGQRPYVRGTVGMPKGIDDTGGCQIFITHLPTPHLDGRYTVFGQVVEGFAAVDAIRIGDRIVKAKVELAGE